MRRSLVMPVLVGAAAVGACLPMTAIASPADPQSAHRTAATGGPGATAVFQPADKQGYGTSHSTASKVWFTLENGGLSDTYFPNASTPSLRSLQFVVTDGHSFTDVESRATTHRIHLLDRRSLTYRQVDTARSGDYRITKTYVTDPSRSTVMMRVGFRSLTGRPYRLFVVSEPALGNDTMHDTGRTLRHALVASASHDSGAIVTSPRLGPASNGYLGTASSGLAQLRRAHRLTQHNALAARGDIVQVARTALDGRRGHRTLTLALGFSHSTAGAMHVAGRSLHAGFATIRHRYQVGWHRFLQSVKPVPASAARYRTLYDVSVMVLAAGEDKTHRGAFVASPTMPWEWATPKGTAPSPSGPYHLVWARDLYQIATALLLAGDRGAAQRAEHYLFFTQQEKDGSFPQNSTTGGTPYWTGKQLDEWSFPTILAWELGDTSKQTWSHVERAANLVVTTGPQTDQERWENQSGYSPATLAAEVAGLVDAAQIAKANGAPATAAHYLSVADDWQSHIEDWTVTTNGPLSSSPYFLRLTKNGEPNTAVTYPIGDSGPSAVDQRAVVDPSFLELVRLGVLPANDPDVLSTLPVIDQHLEVTTPEGPMWHRYSYDGYGETATGGPWVIQGTGTPATYGRLWPLLSGERGEYEIAAGHSGAPYLAAMAGAANAGYLLPEQVWDGRAPTGTAGRRIGTPTLSATPLLWTHAEFVRLAWDIQAGRLLEQPAVVACRYTGTSC